LTYSINLWFKLKLYLVKKKNLKNDDFNKFYSIFDLKTKNKNINRKTAA